MSCNLATLCNNYLSIQFDSIAFCKHFIKIWSNFSLFRLKSKNSNLKFTYPIPVLSSFRKYCLDFLICCLRPVELWLIMENAWKRVLSVCNFVKFSKKTCQIVQKGTILKRNLVDYPSRTFKIKKIQFFFLLLISPMVFFTRKQVFCGIFFEM